MSLRTLVLSQALIFAAGRSMAQVAPQSVAEPAGAIEEIVVTAQKRSEDAQRVPITIEAFSGAQLEQRGVESATDLPALVPGLMITQDTGIGQIFLRGIGTDSVAAYDEGSVGVYVDGVYNISPLAATQAFSDVQRVEVLKGPQGTLYGRNTTGGAINIVTLDPSSQPTVSASASYGNLDNSQFKLYAAGGTDIVAGSVSAFMSKRDGYLRNLVTGTLLDDQYVWGVRGKLKYTMNDAWSIILAADYSKSADYDGSTYSLYSNNAIATLLGGNTTLDPRATYSAQNINVTSLDRGASATVRGDLGGINLVSISGFRLVDFIDGTDADGSNLVLEDLRGALQSSKSFSQEFQVLSPTGSRLEWIGGLYGFYQQAGADVPIYAGPSFIQATGELLSRSYALFGQGTYHFTDQWDLTLGARESWDRKLSKGTNTSIDGAVAIAGARDSHDWNNFSPKLSVNYHRPGVLLYLTAATGYKSGATALTTSNAPFVNPEKVSSGEIGGKHNFADGRAKLNWALFYNDYKNLQVNVVETNAGEALTALSNAGRARIYGVDMDFTLAPLPHLEITESAEYLHARYSDFGNALIYVPNGATGGFGYVPAPATDGGATGKDLQRAPTVTASTQISYLVPMSAGDLRFTGVATYNSGYYLDIGNLTRQGSYVTLNARAEYDFAEHYSLFIFGNNLSNREVITANLSTPLANLVTYSVPRVYGVGMKVKF